MRSVENAEYRKYRVWKMRSVKEKYIKSLKEKNKVISPHVGITPNTTPSRPMPPVRTLEKHSTLNEMKKIIFFVCLFSKPRNLVLVKHVFRILEK